MIYRDIKGTDYYMTLEPNLDYTTKITIWTRSPYGDNLEKKIYGVILK